MTLLVTDVERMMATMDTNSNTTFRIQNTAGNTLEVVNIVLDITNDEFILTVGE